MSTAPEAAISRAASRLRLVVFATMVLMAAIYVAAQLGLQLGHARVEYRLHGVGAPYARLIGGGSLALLLVALFRLTQMLGRIAAGEMFTASAIRSFRGFAFWLLLMALFELTATIVAGLPAATMSSPHHVRVPLDLRDLLTVGITLLLFLLARLLERARALDEEMREFV